MTFLPLQRLLAAKGMWRVPALTWAVVCLVIQSPALQNRSFEPDEGMRVYCARQLLQGQLPYRDFWDHKDPVEWFLCGLLLKVFGDSLIGLRLGVNVLRALLIYHLAAFGHQSRATKNLWLLGGLAFVLLTSETIQGNTAGMEAPGLLLFILAMRIALLAAEVSGARRCIFLTACGTCAGLGILVKTTTAVACLAPLILLASVANSPTNSRTRTRFAVDMALLISGLLIPVIVVACWCLRHGIFHDWLFVLTVYNPAYSQSIPHGDYLSGVLPSRLWFLLPFTALGVLGFLRKSHWRPWVRICIGAWFVCAALSVSVGWRFYPHYFLLLAPPLALMGANAIQFSSTGDSRNAPLRTALTAAISFAVVFNSAHAIKWYLVDVREWEPPQLGFFTTESVNNLTLHIRETTKPDEPIYVFGYCPDIYVLSNRRAASRFSFLYPLAAEHSPLRQEASREVLLDLSTSRPKYIVVMKKDWTPQYPAESVQFVRDWPEMSAFLEDNYRLEDSQDLFDLYITSA
ncbi:MAG: hypothetical protein ABIH23_36260 [bacterium]